MNLPPRLQLTRTDRSIGGVLSAVGSLLQALGGERAESDSPSAPPVPVGLEMPAPMALPSSAIPPTRMRGGDPTDEVSALLADARARAQAIMDESMARAEELLRPPADLPEQQTLERIRRTVADIATDVRGLHSRLDEIELLVRAQSSERPARRPDTAPSPIFGSARMSQPAPEPPAFGSASRSTFASPVADVSAPAPPAPAPTPEPPPLLPTSWAGLAASTPEPPAPALALPEPPAAQAPPSPASEPASTIDAFDPVSGPISLHVSPVAGFQGLMRVQDALVRIRGVREAGVEAYAQGEARLRLRLSAEMDAASLATALTELLGRATRVAASSTSERTLRLVLE